MTTHNEEEKPNTMNKRQTIINDLSDAEVPQESIEIVTDLIDVLEGQFNEIAHLLSTLTLDTMANVEDAHEIAKDAGMSIY